MNHTRNTRIVLFLIVAALLTAIIFPAAAQDETAPKLGYFIAPDADGIQQVFQLILDGESEPSQITFAEADVTTFGVAYDGLGVAYISDGQLIITSIHSDLPEVLAEITAEFYSAPVFSQDGNYLAYSDNGAWLIDLSTREGRQLIADVPLEENASNAGEYALYLPQEFIPGTTKLIVDVGVWEWNTVGILDYETGELNVLQGQVHTDLTPRNEQSVLLFGNGGVAGEFALEVGTMALDAYERALDFSTLTEDTLYAQQARWISPDMARIVGEAAVADQTDSLNIFSFDFDAQFPYEASNYSVISVKMPDGETTPMIGEVSPDGQFIAVYLNPVMEANGQYSGDVAIFDLTTGEALEDNIPAQVAQFQWQPVPATVE